MKKLILGAVLMFASFAVSAASVNITNVSGAVDWGDGTFTQAGSTSTFELSQSAFAIGSALIEFSTSLTDWSYTLTGPSLSLSGGTFLANVELAEVSLNMLQNVIYTLTVTGDVGNSVRFNSNFVFPIEVSEVPLPAAVWLFGSVLLGGLAIRRRSQKLNAQAVAA